MKRLALATVVVLGGCIDFDALSAQQLAGFGDAGVDGGADAGGTDAGVDAGYDGGTPCATSTRPRLRCDAPITLGTSTQAIVTGALVANEAGFIAGWAGSTVEVRLVHGDGTLSTLVTGQPVTGGNPPQMLSLGASGSHWVATWASSAGGNVLCQTDRAGSPSAVTLRDGGALIQLAAAMSPSGAVAVTALNQMPFGAFAAWAAGCPNELQPIANFESLSAVSVAATTAPGGGGFRFTQTSLLNAYNGLFVMTMLDGDAGVQITQPINSHGPGALTSAASKTGTTVFSAITTTDMNSAYQLGLWGTSADLSNDGATNYFVADPGSFNVTDCGAGCMAVGVVPYTTAISSVFFFTDDTSVTPRGGWDVGCNGTPGLNGGTISVATFGGRLGVLLTSGLAAKLQVCDLPPLP